MVVKTRDYTEATKYESTPKQKKRRAMRNKARRMFMKKGLVHKGDGIDIDHRNHNALDDNPNNLRKRSIKANRSDNLGKGGRPKGKSKRGRKKS